MLLKHLWHRRSLLRPTVVWFVASGLLGHTDTVCGSVSAFECRPSPSLWFGLLPPAFPPLSRREKAMALWTLNRLPVDAGILQIWITYSFDVRENCCLLEIVPRKKIVLITVVPLGACEGAKVLECKEVPAKGLSLGLHNFIARARKLLMRALRRSLKVNCTLDSTRDVRVLSSAKLGRRNVCVLISGALLLFLWRIPFMPRLFGMTRIGARRWQDYFMLAFNRCLTLLFVSYLIGLWDASESITSTWVHPRTF